MNDQSLNSRASCDGAWAFGGRFKGSELREKWSPKETSLTVARFGRGCFAVLLSAYLPALVILPEVLDVCLGQALVGTVGLLPPLKATSEDAHLLSDRGFLRYTVLSLLLLFSGLWCCCSCC